MGAGMKPGQRVIAALRRMIVTGEFRDGERIAEIPTAERLGVSRMPVRTALRVLEQEGLVVKLGARGYAARPATMRQAEDAIHVRGVLEGLAARIAAGRPDHDAVADRLTAVLERGERVFAEGADATEIERFYEYNLTFHTLLVEVSGNDAIAFALARNDHLPFASATAMLFDWRDIAWEHEHLLEAHRQHHAVVAAIRSGNAALAEALMRDHASISLASIGRFERLGVEIAHVAQRLK